MMKINKLHVMTYLSGLEVYLREAIGKIENVRTMDNGKYYYGELEEIAENIFPNLIQRLTFSNEMLSRMEEKSELSHELNPLDDEDSQEEFSKSEKSFWDVETNSLPAVSLVKRKSSIPPPLPIDKVDCQNENVKEE